MRKPVVVIGVGEMGGVFVRGLLRIGFPVFPVRRNDDMSVLAEQIDDPEFVLLAVGENDLHPALEKIPTGWRERLVLLQNELLPRDWQQHQLSNPTVISVWFEKKKGQDFKVLIPSPVFGPHAQDIVDALSALEIPTKLLNSAEQLTHELVVKNVYILTTNISGLIIGGTVKDLWYDNEALARSVANETIDIQESMTGQKFDREQLIAGMCEGIEGDLQHKCMGRSAPARLARALDYADKHNLAVPRMREIQAQQ